MGSESGSNWRWKQLLEKEDALQLPSDWVATTPTLPSASDRLSQRLSEKITLHSLPTTRHSRRTERPRTWTESASPAITDLPDPAPISTLPKRAPKRPPVVLVHGFGGWGRNEMGGQFFYWGGFQDIAQKMMDKVHSAISPKESYVWDRAVELFYQIKGGTVDYGAAHSQEFGHDRWGSTFPGLYPEWDADHPVDIVGHSMGGLTARALVQLLHDNGRCKGEADLFPHHAGLSARWVRSVTTISTPHDGSPAADMAAAMHSVIFSTMAMSVGLMGAVSNAEVAFDFKLRQWGIAPRGSRETWADYYARVTTAKVFTEGTKDLSEYDLTLQGAAELNSWAKDHPEVFYLSYESCSSYASPLAAEPDATHLPIFSTRAIFLPSCYLLGQGLPLPTWTRDHHHHVHSASWRPNDGMVPCRSQRGPTFVLERGAGRSASGRGHGGSSSPRAVLSESQVVDHSGGVCAGLAGQRGNKCKVDARKLRPGVWNFLGRLDELDHLACIGWTDKTVWDFVLFMRGHLKILAALPSLRIE